MELRDFINLGMTPVEARIYEELCKTGSSQIGPLIKKTALHRGTVYNSIRRLAEKGFVTFLDKQGVRCYFPSGTKIFQEIIEQEEKRIKEKKEKFKDFTQEILNKKKIEEAKVEVLLGDTGFKLFIRELQEWARTSGKEYLFIGKGDEILEHFGKEYDAHKEYQERRDKIKKRVILSELSSEIISEKKYVRYLSPNFFGPISTWIFDNKVVLVLWQTKPIMTLVIESEDANLSYRGFFEALWINQNRSIESREDYTSHLMRSWNSNVPLKIISRFDSQPRIFFPLENLEEYNRYREIIAGHRKQFTDKRKNDSLIQSYKKRVANNAPIKQIVYFEAVNKFFKSIEKNLGKQELNKRIKQINLILNKSNFKIRVTAKIFPFNTHISTEEMFLAILEDETLFGIDSHDPKTIRIFEKLFEDAWKDGTDLENYLKDNF